MTIKCTGYEWNAFYNDPEFWKEVALIVNAGGKVRK